MALDVGLKTIGIALSDPLRVTVRPLDTLRRVDLETDTEAVAELLRRHEVTRLIVGLPSHLDGRPARILLHIKPLVEALRSRAAVRLDWYDERLSTREAEQLMADNRVPVRERRRKRNEYAAALILRWYLQDQEKSNT